MEDIKIIEFFNRRNQAAINESSIKYGKMLYCISFGILENNEDSEECVNDTYLKAWNSIPPQNPQSLSAYFGRIIRNISINRWHEKHAKKRGGGNYVLLSELLECSPAREPRETATPETALEKVEITNILNNWLGMLPKNDRVLFLRRYWFCENVNELAAEAGTTPVKLSSRIFRLRQKLKTELEKEEITL